VATLDLCSRLNGCDATYRQAMDTYRQGDYRQAIELFQQLPPKNNPQGVLVRYYLSRAHRCLAQQLMDKSDYDGAIAHLQAALDNNPGSPTLIEMIARCLIAKNDYSAAAERYALLHQMQPGRNSGKLRLALSYLLAGQRDQSRSLLQGILKDDPHDFHANYFLGLLLADEERYEAAQRHLVQACRLRNNTSAAHLQLGMVHAARGHFEQALQALQKAHQLDPRNDYIALNIALAGKVLDQQGRKTTIRLLPPNDDEPSQLPADRRMDRLAQLIAAEPQFIQAFLDLPNSQMDRQIFSQLLNILLNALKQCGQYADLHYYCSKVYRRLGQTNLAIEYSQRALQINPRYINALIHLAQLYCQADRRQQAIDRLQHAISIGADYPDVHYMLGNLYREQGFTGKARQHYRKALHLNQNYHAARQALQALAA